MGKNELTNKASVSSILCADESVTSATPQRQVLSQQTPGGDTGVSMSGSGVGVSGSSVGTGRVIPLTSGTTASQGASVDSATASQSEAGTYRNWAWHDI